MADTGIGVKLAVTSLNDFKRDIQQGRDSIKTLDAALRNNEESFKATGDSATYMQQKIDLLKSKLKLQQEEVEKAEATLKKMQKGGVDPLSSAYQTMQQNMLNAQTAATKTSNEIKSLGEGNKTAAQKADDLSDSLGEIQKHTDFDAVIKGINKITNGMEQAAKKAWNLAKGLYGAASDASVWADDLITQSTEYGIDIETLQQWEYAAKFIDTEVDTVLKARDKLTKSKGTKDGAGILDALGINPEGMTTMDLFWATLEKLGNAGENQEEWALALFGKSFRELMPLMKAGREEWDRLSQEAPVVSDENVTKLGEANDALEKMNSTLETTKLEMLSALAPAFTELANAISGFVSSEKGQKVIEDITNMITNGLRWLIDNKDTVIGVIEGLGAAFAGLKVSEGVLTFVNGAKGLKNLFSGSSGSGAGSGATGGSSARGLLKTGIGYAGKMFPFALPAALGIDAFLHEAREQALGKQLYAQQAADFNANLSAGYANDPLLGAYFREFGNAFANPNGSDVSLFNRLYEASWSLDHGGSDEWFENLYNNLSDAATDMIDNMTSVELDRYQPEEKSEFVRKIYDSILASITSGTGFVPTTPIMNGNGPVNQSLDYGALEAAVSRGASNGNVNVTVNVDGEQIYNTIMRKNGTWLKTRGFY